MYAAMNLQLYNQLSELGYNNNDLEIIINSYEVAKELCSCQQRPSGATQLNHLIGTSSILASLKVPIEICAAGLLHSIYVHGDFGDGKKEKNDFKRKYLKENLGDRIEEYIAAYADLNWFGKDAISNINKRIRNYSEFEKNVVLIRIADALDEFIDFGNLYVPNPKARINYFKKVIPEMAEIAKKIGFPSLGEELKIAIVEHEEMNVPTFLNNSKNKVFLVPPMDCKKKLNIALVETIDKIQHGITRILNRKNIK